MTCRCCSLSAFRWAEFHRHSIFYYDPAFTPKGESARTMSQIVSDAVSRYEQEHGRSLGTIMGISDAADAKTAQRQEQRRAGRK